MIGNCILKLLVLSIAKSSKYLSALALFVARVLADHPHNVLALYYLARFTKSFY
jgi:hypothetical protein